MSSSKSEYECIDLYGAGGYQFEPEFTESELASMTLAQNDSENDAEDNYVRLNNLLWCTLEKCEGLPTMRECTCCKEFEHYVDNYIGDDVQCITMHADFDMICLNNTVLETAYDAFMRYKQMRGRAPAFLTHRQSRLMAYRQFLSWVRRGQPLGKKNRVILPACVVSKVRKTFPEESNQYEGFHSESSSSDSD